MILRETITITVIYDSEVRANPGTWDWQQIIGMPEDLTSEEAGNLSTDEWNAVAECYETTDSTSSNRTFVMEEARPFMTQYPNAIPPTAQEYLTDLN